MNSFKLILPVAAMAALGGCIVTGGGPTETRDFSLAGFDSIDAGGGINVVVSQGPFSVRAEAPEGKLDNIEIEQRGNQLRVGRKSEISWFGSSGRYVVNVSAPEFVRIEASGGSDIEAARLESCSLALSASGGADIEIANLKIGTLDASTSGGGDMELSGSCTTAAMSASGGGNIDAEDLSCGSVTATAAGGGDIDAWATASANGKASGGGDVRFHGSPAQFTADETSGGNVKLEGR